MSCVIADQDYYQNNKDFSNFSFERYEMGRFSHHAIRAYDSNQSYMLDVSLADGTGTGGTAETGISGGLALWTTNVNVRMIQRTEESMKKKYGDAAHQYKNAARLTQRLLLVMSACVFAKYLKDANGNYNRFTNNCQHFCNDLVEMLVAGQVAMPDGYQMSETPEKVKNGKYINFNYEITHG